MKSPNDELPQFDDDQHLLPAIAQEASSGRVLMLGWMNRAAFNETVESGKAVYFSRSRNSLWRKGETSGHVQEVEQILVDCDADAILLRVHQTGAACHAGFTSCFYRELNRTDNSWQEFEPRQFDPADVYGKSTPPSPPNPNE